MINPNQLGRSPFPAGASQWMLVGLRGGPVAPPQHLLGSLISYWKLDEASGTRADSVGANNLGAVNAPVGASGKINNGALCVAASSQYLQISSNPSLQVAGTDFTFSAWVKLASAPTSLPYIIFGKGTSGTPEYAMFYFPSTGFQFFTQAGGSSAASSGSVVANGVWTHVVSWFDFASSLCHIRINDATTYDAAATNTVGLGVAQFCIGAISDPTWFCDGMIDEVGYWKRLLTAQEITALYNGGAGLPFSSFTA
jgi:hypothetical protein